MDLLISGLASRMRRRSVAFLLICILALIEHSAAARNEVRCASIDIRNNPFFGTSTLSSTTRSETECTIVEGDFSLSMITEDGIGDDMFPVFKNLREITGALLVFQIKGLSSLGKMFPNLRVIGGHSLIMNYALVIYQNQDLRNVGLTKLTIIKNGGVRIAENSRLCYTRNINWDNMIVGNLRDVILDTAESQCQDQCTVANESRCYRPRPGIISCWNSTECQQHCPHYKYENGTFGPGCSENGDVCHHYCLGGCTHPNDPGSCHTCRFVEIHGICAEKCPETMYEQLGRRCLTKEQCHSLRPMSNTVSTREDSAWKAFNGRCHYDCPTGFEEDSHNNRSCVKCVGHCPKKCRGDETIDSAGAALKFRDCNIVDGFLEIEIRIGNEANAEKFSEAFGELEEVTGYLMIRFSSVFVSLHMFKKLRVIHGNQLWRGGYSLVVFDNQNLRELFNLKRQSMKIVKGKVQFQNNRMLCYKKIDAFLEHIGKLEEVTDIDVSTYSNGDKAVCDEVPLEVEVTFVYSDGFSIRWTPFNTSDMDYRKFIGYQIFYKKVETIDHDLSIDEDRSACADTWKMQFSDAMPPNEATIDEIAKAHDGGALISHGIEANTIYAFYVQTRIVNHPGARNAISKVQFVKTHFGNPDPPRIKGYNTRGPDRIEVIWAPPISPQGVITHYTVQWQYPEVSERVEDINGCGEELHKPAPEVLVSKKTVKQGTCSVQKGCCDCSLLNNTQLTEGDQTHSGISDIFTEDMELSREEKDAFENAIQNKVFVQQPQGNESEPNTASRNKRQAKMEDAKMDPMIAKSIAARNETAFNISLVNVSDPNFPDEFRQNGKINITGNRLMLTGLPHFTEYNILIFACQDVNEPDNSCSARPAWVNVRTAAAVENDKVLPETVHVLNVTNGKEGDRRFNWIAPEDPNGVVLAYKVKLFRDDVDTTPLYRCVNRTQFIEDEGVTFTNLAGGTYSIEIRTVTLAGVGLPTLIKDILYLHIPFMSRKTFFIVSGSLLSLVLLVTFIAYFLIRYYCRKIDEEKVHQLLSSNPEYLSQIDVYKKDEWELPRDKIILGKEIGAGTFGKVYRGIGNDVMTVNGVTFGECAIKTISEQNANMDRFHFLIEASVMKQFNTNYIVKLFGVVSDTPVFVVMELMEKGNLRDFLRAHRPGSEENAGSRYSLPTPEQYYNWAAQIADGMAYLESIRFCHRDLAARNCMVHADESVKIGDFGMARDIYYREYYKPQGRRLMPIRWLSPESLKDGKFTLKSDVWSYGVVLYEMLTLGQQPYAGLANSQVFNYVCVQKKIMVRPKNCPVIWYKLMRSCWEYDGRDRPFFYQIVDYLRSVTNEDFHSKSFVYNTDTIKRNDGDYNFEKEFPPMEGESRENSVELNEDEKKELPESFIEPPVLEQQEEESSCSCSECSDGEHNEVNYIDPMQKNGVRNYLRSLGVNPGNQYNAMSANKSRERDMERLLDVQSDDDDLPHLTGMSNSFASQSTPSTTRISSQQTRRTIDSEDKRAIHKALKNAKTKEGEDGELWPNVNEFEPSEIPSDYLMADPANSSFDHDQPGPSFKD